MKKIWGIAMILVLLPFGVKAATKWDMVGNRPTSISLNRSVETLGLSATSVTSTFPDTIWVRKGDYFPVMTFGPGSVCRDIYVGFDSTKALRWSQSDGTEVIFVLGCNNVGHRPATLQPQAAAPVETLAAAAPTSNCPFQWWWLLPLLLLIPLFWLWRRERRRRQEDAERHRREMEEARALPPVIPVPIAIGDSGRGSTTAAAPTPVLEPSPEVKHSPTFTGLIPVGTPLAIENAERVARLTKRAEELALEDSAVQMMVDEFEVVVTEHDKTNKETKRLLMVHGIDYYARTRK